MASADVSPRDRPLTRDSPRQPSGEPALGPMPRQSATPSSVHDTIRQRSLVSARQCWATDSGTSRYWIRISQTHYIACKARLSRLGCPTARHLSALQPIENPHRQDCRHTDGIELLWSTFKRARNGTFRKMSAQLDR